MNTVKTLILTGSIITATVQADEYSDYDPDLFVGGSVSYSKLDNLSVSGNDVSELGDLNEFDDDRSSWKGYAGIWLNSWFGIEGQYLNLGEYTNSGVKVDPSGKTAAVMLGIPLTEQTRFVIKGGKLWWETDVDGPLNYSSNHKGNTFFYGAGLSAAVLPHVNIRAEYERAKFDDDNFKADLDFASLGAEFIF